MQKNWTNYFRFPLKRVERWSSDNDSVYMYISSSENVTIKDETPLHVRALILFSPQLLTSSACLHHFASLKLNAHQSIICVTHTRCRAELWSGAQHLSLVCSQSRNSPRCRHANPCGLYQWEDVDLLWIASDWLSLFKSLIVKCTDRLTFNSVSAGKFWLQAGMHWR